MTRVGVVFGGRSVEHEVSVLTAMQVMAAFPDGLTAVPVYIDKEGRWYTGDRLRTVDAYRDVRALTQSATRVTLRPEPGGPGALLIPEARRGLLGGARDSLRVDVVMPLVHGTHGEDGTLQGLFELCDVPYTGSGVAAAAVSMDKRLAKAAFRAVGLAVVDDAPVMRDAWHADAAAVMAAVERRFAYPMYVKPVSLGSSIGVSRVESQGALRDALELALAYDWRCIVEPSQEGVVEVNCAVLGRGDALRASACEQPKPGGLLTYEDKYLSKSAKGGGKSASTRVIPAPLSDTMTARVQEAAVDAFRAIGAEGVARVDFLLRPERDEILVNEINTVPGSLAFYLWEPLGLRFDQLVAQLVTLAQQRYDDKMRTTYSIDTWLLTGRAGG